MKTSVKMPEEDPAVKAERERAQRRAEAARTEETQALLMGDTIRRFRRFGRIGSGGSVALSRPVVRGSGGGSSGGGGSSAGGGFAGVPGGSGSVAAELY